MSENYKEKFPKVWICPYCVQQSELEEDATVEREDIPNHLLYQHEWEIPHVDQTWEHIYSRLIAFGGV